MASDDFLKDNQNIVVNIWSGSKKFIKVVLREERILVLGQLWWKVLIHFTCWLVNDELYKNNDDEINAK